MFKRDWNGAGALVLGLLFLGLFLFGLQVGAGQSTHTKDKEHHAGITGGDTDEELDRRCDALAERQEALDCLREQVAAASEDERSKHDLNAQQSMAQSAVFMLWITASLGLLTLGLSGYAALLLRDTLREARETTKSAAKGVAEAAETNSITRAAYINDLRPWLSIGEPQVWSIEVKNGQYRVATSLGVKNVGKSPATTVRLHAAFYQLGLNVRHARSLDQFCKECVAEDPAGRNRLLFPDQGDELRNSTDRDLLRGTQVPKVVGVRFMLCVTYKSIVSETPFHIGVAGTAIVKPMREIGKNETLTAEDIEVITRNEYTSMN